MTSTPLLSIAPWWRASLIGVSTATVSSAAHVAGGGQLPHLAAGLVVTLLLSLLAVPVARDVMSLRKWLTALTIWQGLAHVLWTISAAVGAAPLAATGHHHHGGGPESLVSASAGATSDSFVPMLCAHALGVVVTGVLAAALEQSVRRIGQWLVPLTRMGSSAFQVIQLRGTMCLRPQHIWRSGRRYGGQIDRGPPGWAAA